MDISLLIRIWKVFHIKHHFQITSELARICRKLFIIGYWTKIAFPIFLLVQGAYVGKKLVCVLSYFYCNLLHDFIQIYPTFVCIIFARFAKTNTDIYMLFSEKCTAIVWFFPHISCCFCLFSDICLFYPILFFSRGEEERTCKIFDMFYILM